MDKITPLGPKMRGKRIPANATADDMRMIRNIYDAAGNAHAALGAFVGAVVAFMDVHPEHEELGPLLVSFGIDPDEWADLLSIGPTDGEDGPE